ncbi:glycosyltransferase family 25 protein [uncultured Nitratireductor sp.]|uniref:glycosyltransferase family 25 protein n=1 Tax=uncultured Nitratireductor sp. TaxID=520953 RepID=UPI002621E50B|nr:glycosyltransferase family 25 protein [uncultured Nitratireductor sp.]
MKTLVINLERETSRLAHMRRVFGEQGLDFEVIKAVDAKELSLEHLEVGRVGEPRFYELGAGEVACFLSHRKCWEIAASSDSQYTVICEDDLYLGDNAAAIFGDSNWIPAGTGIVRLEACRPKHLVGTRAVASFSGRQLHVLFRAYAGAGAYILERGFASELIREAEFFSDPVDQFLFNPDRLARRDRVFYQLSPAVAIQEYFLKPETERELGSVLRGERRAKRLVGLSKLQREIGRPVKQFSSFVSGLWAAVFLGRRWVRVPFR